MRNRNRIQIQIQGFDEQKEKKYTAEKNYFFDQNIAIYLSLGLCKKRQSFRRSFQPSKAHLKLNFLNFLSFSGSLLPFRIRIRFPNADPNPADQNH